jgi:hypothetical protein
MFTTFENWCGLKLENDPSFVWTVGTVIRVFDRKRVPQLGKRDPFSHMKRIYDAPSVDLTAWGPYQGEMSAHIRNAMYGLATVVLVAAGSGIGYVMDALQWAVADKHTPHLPCHLKVLFTTRDKDLLVWVKKFSSEIIATGYNTNIQILLALTKGFAIDATIENAEAKAGIVAVVSGHSGFEDDIETIEQAKAQPDTITIVSGRIGFEDEIEEGSVVFCQGGAALKDHVSAICRAKRVRFFGGLGGS